VCLLTVSFSGLQNLNFSVLLFLGFVLRWSCGQFLRLCLAVCGGSSSFSFSSSSSFSLSFN